MKGASALPISRNGIVLRRLDPSDLGAFQAYRCDTELGRYQGWSATGDSEAAAFLSEMKAAALFQPGVWFQIGIARVEDPRLIGDIGLLLADEGNEVEVGFTLSRESQGRGIAAAAVSEVISFVFQHTAVERVVAITDVRNTASVRLLERVGMQRRRSCDSIFRGEACVEHGYAISRADWRVAVRRSS